MSDQNSTTTTAPRVWALPEPPGPEVQRIRDRDGAEYVREPGRWNEWTVNPDRLGNGWEWAKLLTYRGPITEVQS